jgi:hypothetical protein
LIFLILRKKWLSTSSSLRWIYSHLLPLLHPFTFLEVYLLSIFLPFFSFCSSNLQTLGIKRKNHHSHWTTPPSMSRSDGWSRSYRSDQCRN